jgi:hypothetical protein
LHDACDEQATGERVARNGCRIPDASGSGTFLGDMGAMMVDIVVAGCL